MPIKNEYIFSLNVSYRYNFNIFIQQWCGLRDFSFTSQTTIHPKGTDGLQAYSANEDFRNAANDISNKHTKQIKFLEDNARSPAKRLATQLEPLIILQVISMGLQMFPNST